MSSLPWRLSLSDGSLEGLKWLALVSMVYDHVVRLLFMGPVLGDATAFGRIAFPLFAFIFAYNLSRPNVDARVYRRTVLRLIGFGVLAQPAMYYLIGVWQLNILFALAAFAALLWILHDRAEWYALPAAFLLFWVAGTQVEYGWHGLILMLSFAFFIQQGLTVLSLFGLSVGVFALAVINGNHWGTLSLPIIFLASSIRLPIPRTKWFFYLFYPAHLTLIACIAWYFVR